MPIDHVNALPPGTRFEEYRLDAVLGAGGFGITYRAYDANLDKFVAIKEYLPSEFATRAERYTVVPQSSTDAQDYHWGLNRFLGEARTLARFDHPHLNKVYRFFESNGTAYMVLEYVEGETLADRLSKEPYLEEADLQRLLEEVLSGLAVMHDAGYVHRDIKPGNLMLREEDGSAVVLDFGAARQAVGQRSKAITSILTPGYAPIEQYDSKADDVGPWSDIYALGMVAYRCVSGLGDSELPDAVTRGRIQRKGQVDLPPAVEAGKGKYNAKLLDAIDWAIEVNEDDRPRAVGEWQRALAGDGRRKGQAKSVRRTAAKSANGGETTERTGMNWSGVAMTVVILALVGVSGWMASQLYPEWFGLSGSDSSLVAQQEIPADMSGETPQETELGEKWEALASTEQTPLPEDTSQTARAKTAVESDETIAEQPETAPAKAPPAEKDEVARLMAAAEADLKARRLTKPEGNNAWDRYLRILELMPAHPEAVKGLDRVIEGYKGLFADAVELEDFDKATGYLSSIRDLNPDSPMLEEGEQRLKAARQARADRLAEQESKRLAEEEARQAERERERQATLAREAMGEMVEIPGGTFRMGDLSGEGGDDEKPVRSVTVSAFSMGKYEVTVGQFRRFVEAVGYLTDAERNAGSNEGCKTWKISLFEAELVWTPGHSWKSLEYTIEEYQPVVCVSWNDAQAFVQWLTEHTAKAFRLPTEAEWEYAVRAGSKTKYYFGNEESELCSHANVADNTEISEYMKWTNPADCNDGALYPKSVGNYRSNVLGLYDMYGNVWEWVQDCWNESYVSAPTDGSAWTSGDCGRRVMRGGSWSTKPRHLRSANRDWSSRSYRSSIVGFRLAQDN